MIRKFPLKLIVLFLFFFLFQWGGQLSAALASKEAAYINPYLISLYFCFFMRAIIWFILLRNMSLVKAYTLSSISYLVIPTLSFFILREPFVLKHLYGGLLIIFGIILFGSGEQRRQAFLTAGCE